MSAILFVVGPIIWFIPPSSPVSFTPTSVRPCCPRLARPSEGAYVAIAMKTMPAGLMGLLITGIFSATMSSMDTGLNRNAGVFVKNVYQPLFRPHASERELVTIGRSRHHRHGPARDPDGAGLQLLEEPRPVQADAEFHLPGGHPLQYFAALVSGGEKDAALVWLVDRPRKPAGFTAGFQWARLDVDAQSAHVIRHWRAR